MSNGSGFGKLVPGFDFLQSLVKNAGSALPGRLEVWALAVASESLVFVGLAIVLKARTGAAVRSNACIASAAFHFSPERE